MKMLVGHYSDELLVRSANELIDGSSSPSIKILHITQSDHLIYYFYYYTCDNNLIDFKL